MSTERGPSRTLRLGKGSPASGEDFGSCGRSLLLDVEPAAAGARVAEPLAPDGDGLAHIRHRDLAVVPVDLAETVVADVPGRAGGRVADLHRDGPARASIRRAPVPDVPGVGVVAVRGLHVPDADVPTARRGEARLGGGLAAHRERDPSTPGATGVRRLRPVDPLRSAGRLRAFVGEDEMSRRVVDDGALADVEVGLAAVSDAAFADRGLGDDNVLPGLALVPRDDRVVPDLAIDVLQAGVHDAALREDDGSVAENAGVVGVVVALVVAQLLLHPRLAVVV